MKHGRLPRPTQDAAKPPAANRVRRVTIAMAVLVVGGVGAVLLDREVQRREFQFREASLDTLHATLAETRGEVESRKRTLEELQEKERHLDSLDQQKETLASEIAALERELNTRRTELADAVQDVRTKAAGTTLPEVRLANGQVLNGVRLLSVSNSEVSLSHDRGMLRLPGQSLPLDLQDRFRFGSFPTDTPAAVQSSSPIGTSARPAAPTPASAATAPTPTPPSASKNSAANAERMQTLNTTVSALRARLLAMENQANSDLRQAQRLSARDRKLHPMATPGGRSTKTMEQMEREGNRKSGADGAKAEAVMARNKEINALREKITQIEGEIRRIANGYP
jgi:hypothetical protein